MTRVGFYDDPVFGEHDAGNGHPERPERLDAVRRGLREAGLADLLLPCSARPATRAELLRVHTPAHVDRVAAAAGKRVRFDADTQTGPRPSAAALRRGSSSSRPPGPLSTRRGAGWKKRVQETVAASR